MTISGSGNNHHLLYLTTVVFFLAGLALVDTFIIAWCAGLVTLWPIAVSVLSYLLIAVGVLFTFWQVPAIGNRAKR